VSFFADGFDLEDVSEAWHTYKKFRER
jgi:hypothetical protein